MNSYQPRAHITAVLGATNTGKTHYAVERMLGRVSGVIGLPLRLLAREIYDRVVAEKGAASCALITGEEKIVPTHARYFICTVEAMPMEDIKAGKFACVIVDEVQMMAHPERGHVFTDRLLYARGTEETLLLGADTARPIIETLVPEARYVTRERFSVLSYAGHKKLTRLPKRSVIVAFSADEVYAIAELMRRQYGGVALVMGGLSPRTRNAQAALYQSGEVDYMVATDAIGMGLNLDVDHVAFAALRKFDGQRRRFLRASEIAQIAGRAGRFRNDGTFGTTGQSLPLDDDYVVRIENHQFEPLRSAEWRSTKLDFTSADALLDSLAALPPNKRLRRIAPAADELALVRLLGIHQISRNLKTSQNVTTLWDVCQIPDFRNLGPEAHARQLEDVFKEISANNGIISDAYLERNVNRLNHIEGSTEILSSRLSSIRTWTYIAHKHVWVENSNDWIDRTRQIEDHLSDALHEKLVQRFVDRRTSALLKGIGANTRMDATVTETGDVVAEGHTIGRLNGLLFEPDKTTTDVEAKTLQKTAVLSLAPEIDRRLTQISGCDQNALQLSDQGEFLWDGQAIGKITPGDEFLKPKVALIGGKLGSPALCDLAAGRLRDFLHNEINSKFESLLALKTMAEDPQSFQGSRALANVLYENLGVIRRTDHFKLVKETDKIARGYLRNKSVKFGFYHIFLRDLMKPAAARLMSLIYAFAWKKDGGGDGLPFLPQNGMSSTPNDDRYSEQALNKAGYTRCGTRIVRFDILTRLSEIIIQATKERSDNQFRIAQEMMASLGCSFEDMEQVLISLGYVKNDSEFTPEEFEIEKSRILDMHERQQVAQNKASDPVETLETPKQEQAIQETKPDEKPENYVPKRQRVKPIHDFVGKPVLDDNGDPIIPTTVGLWSRARVPYHRRQRDKSHVGLNQSTTKDEGSSHRRKDKLRD
ncbi:MAG: hypothetical protein EX271_10070, partial [Acidimicrobiales bacterium]